MQIQLKGILFDFDGTLADSMLVNYEAWSLALKKFGITIDRDEYLKIEGLNPTTVAEKYLAAANSKVGSSELIAQVVASKEAYFCQNFSFKTYPGVDELLSVLKSKHIICAMVTGASRHRLDRTVPKDFLEKFATIVSGEPGEKCKPAPDPYLRAQQLVGLANSELLVVENAPLGIKAAKSAGLTCIAVTHTLAATDLEGADLIVADFFALAKTLESYLI